MTKAPVPQQSGDLATADILALMGVHGLRVAEVARPAFLSV
jgi:hypothetical protein